MESEKNITQLIREAKNVCVIPSENNESESIPDALALFYILKELNKNVSLLIQDFPEKFNFLVPSLDFISSPKNFVISVPRNVAEVSQVYYEKNEENLKIHLTIDKGRITKDHVSFYFSEPKPDLAITLGIKDFQSRLSSQLDAFGFILDAPIANIDTETPLDTNNQEENKKVGAINIIEKKSLSEITLDIIKSIDENLITKNVADCLLTGLTIHYENFKSPRTGHQVFETVATLVKKGANRHHIIDNLYKATKEQMHFLSEVFQNLKVAEPYDISLAAIDSDKFQHFAESQISAVVEKIKTIGVQSDLLVLWKSHASPMAIKGFFYSKKQDLIAKVAEDQHSAIKNDWVAIAVPGPDIEAAKNRILSL